MFTEWRIERYGVGISEWVQGEPPKNLKDTLFSPFEVVQRESYDTVVVKRAILRMLWEYYTTGKMISTTSDIAKEVSKVLGDILPR